MMLFEPVLFIGSQIYRFLESLVGDFDMKTTTLFIGTFLCSSNPSNTSKKDIRVEHCFDITEDLPSARKCRGSLWIGLARLSNDDFAVQLFLDENIMSIYRTLQELRTMDTTVFDLAFKHLLQFYGLTPQRFVELVNQALARIN